MKPMDNPTNLVDNNITSIVENNETNLVDDNTAWTDVLANNKQQTRKPLDNRTNLVDNNTTWTGCSHKRQSSRQPLVLPSQTLSVLVTIPESTKLDLEAFIYLTLPLSLHQFQSWLWEPLVSSTSSCCSVSARWKVCCCWKLDLELLLGWRTQLVCWCCPRFQVECDGRDC